MASPANSTLAPPTPIGEGLSRVFMLMWTGWLVSTIGSGLTSFSLAYWAYRRSGSTGELALVMLAYSLPGFVFGPLAGVVADRCNHRRIMLLSSLGAAASTLAVAGALWQGYVPAWQIGIGVSIISICDAFQEPAYLASFTVLLARGMIARGSGLVQLAQSIGLFASPLLAFVLLSVISIQAIMAVDVATYLFFIAVLFAVHIPVTPSNRADSKPRDSLYGEAISAWRYLRSAAGLVPLLALISMIVFAARLVQVVIVPLALGLGPTTVLAILSGGVSAGMVVGSTIFVRFGGVLLKGADRHTGGVLASGIAAGIGLLLAGLALSPVRVAVGLFLLGAAVSFGAASDLAIWQTRTPCELHGRVLAFRRMALTICLPMACIAAGLIVDPVLRPSLAAGGTLAGFFEHFTVLAPVRAPGLFLALAGCATLACTGVVSLLPSLRRREPVPPVVAQQPPAARQTILPENAPF